MAADKQTGGGNFNTTNFTYGSFVGMIIDRNEREAYDAALKSAGIIDADVKKGFGTPESIKARVALKNAGITGYKLTGKLGYMNVREKNIGSEQKPNNQKFLVVGLNDGSETMYLELPVSHDAAGALARKLVNVAPGTVVTINLFATVGDAGFANHAAEVKVDGVEIKTISYKDGPAAVVDSKLEALKAAGINDPEILSKARRSAIGGYNESIVMATQAKFEAYRAANKADSAANKDGVQDSQPAASTEAASVVSGGGFDDSIPFAATPYGKRHITWM